MTLNLYTYGANNPVRFFDPTGHSPESSNWLDTSAQVAGNTINMLAYGIPKYQIQAQNNYLQQCKISGTQPTVMGDIAASFKGFGAGFNEAFNPATNFQRGLSGDGNPWVEGTIGGLKTVGLVSLAGPLVKPAVNTIDSLLSSAIRGEGLEAVSTVGKAADDAYAGVKEASEYLKSSGISRNKRVEILQSFQEGTIKVETAGESTYGLRFHDFGVNASPKGSFLTDTFTPLTNPQNLALPTEWNLKTGITQWQVEPGTKMITGATAPQLEYGSQYVGGANQWWVPKDNLLKP